MLVVDATEEEELRARLQNELDNMADRHDAGVAIYEKAVRYCISSSLRIRSFLAMGDIKRFAIIQP